MVEVVQILRVGVARDTAADNFIADLERETVDLGEATVMNPQAFPLVPPVLDAEPVDLPGQVQQGVQQQEQSIPDLEERQELGPWLDPQIPGPLPVVVDDGDGWLRIESLGAWECGLSSFRALEEVPSLHREKWARASKLEVKLRRNRHRFKKLFFLNLRPKIEVNLRNLNLRQN